LLRLTIFKLCLAIIQNAIVKTVTAEIAVVMEVKTVHVHQLALIAVVTTSN